MGEKRLKVAIAGAGAVGRSIARELVENQHEVTLILAILLVNQDDHAPGAHFGDGAAVVLADPGDDRVGGDGQAPCLLGLLLGVVVSYRAFAGVEQVPAQRVEVLALVQLAGDFASVRLVG